MYNLAPREGLPKNGDTPDLLGPNAYYLDEDKYWRRNVVPFLSSTERNVAFGNQRQNENFHWKDVSGHIKGGSSIRSRAVRFVCKEVDAPGPADYDPKIPSKKQAERIRLPGRGKLYVCEFPRNDYVEGPSVPTRRDENGYALDENGKLIKHPPDEHDTTLGPAFYKVPTRPCLNTRIYKGCEWSKRRSKRSEIGVSPNPGPGAYNLESDLGKIDWRSEDVREMARLLSYVPRTLEANEMRIRKENLPGPCHYNVKSSSLRLTKWMGIKRAPLVSSAGRFCSTEKGRNPSPDTYTLGGFTASQNIPLVQSGFGVNDERFGKFEKKYGPGPAAYNIQWGTINEKFNKKSTFYVSAYAPFNTTAPRNSTYIQDVSFKPSPAEYLVEPLENEKYLIKGCNFLSKTYRFPTNTKPGSVDPSAYNITEAFNKSRDRTSHNRQEVSFQARGERRLFPRKFDTPGPGEYMGHVNFGRNTLTFARSPRFKEAGEIFPGPTTYRISKYASDSVYKATVTHNLRLKENVLRTKLRLPPGKTWGAWYKTLRKKKKLSCFERDAKRNGNIMDFISN